MTYNPSIPNAAQSPGLFPAQAQTNFGRLQTIINADHVFNTTSAATDGIHKQVTMLNRSSPGSLPAGNGILYSRNIAGTSQLFWYNGSAQRPLTGGCVAACVNFDGTGPNGDQVIRSQYNVAVVNKIQAGQYQIIFTTALSNDYIPVFTGMRDTLDSVCYGCVRGDPVYADSVQTTSVIITFSNENGSRRDVLMGNVVIITV